MKKQLIFYLTVTAILIFYSCGSNPDRKTAYEKAIADSVAISHPDTMTPASGKEYQVDEATYPKIAKKKMYLEKGKSVNWDGLKLDTISPGEENENSKIKSLSIPIDSPTKAYVTKANPSIQKIEGTLVYYCPTRMLENTDNNVSVTMTKAAMQEAINQLKNKVVATTGKSPESIRDNITGSSMTIAAKMKVELRYADKDFQTIYKPEYDDQIFDGETDMNWDWIIKPTKVGTLQLSIIVSAFDEKNGRWIPVQAPPKIFNIKVQVDPRGYFSKLWGFFGNNPEWLLTQLLFPLIAFFYGKRQKKKTNSNDD